MFCRTDSIIHGLRHDVDQCHLRREPTLTDDAGLESNRREVVFKIHSGGRTGGVWFIRRRRRLEGGRLDPGA